MRECKSLQELLHRTFEDELLIRYHTHASLLKKRALRNYAIFSDCMLGNTNTKSVVLDYSGKLTLLYVLAEAWPEKTRDSLQDDLYRAITKIRCRQILRQPLPQRSQK